jgi:hypothetical protein
MGPFEPDRAQIGPFLICRQFPGWFTGGHAPLENKMYVRIQKWVGTFVRKEYGSHK